MTSETSMTSNATCVLCGTARDGSEETGDVFCNVRQFKHESFAMWRCRKCHSLHARDEVDLAHYYAGYPFHEMKIDWRLGAMYASMLRRLRDAGVTKQHTILDYGCGGGTLVKYLCQQGYNAVGFDEFSEQFRDPKTLDKKYDVVIAQDVIEHVANPWELAQTFQKLSKPGSVIVIGTPSADGLDLKQPHEYIHALHQPYHRHILSKQALMAVGDKHGWALHRYYPVMYTNTPIPFINARFVTYYLGCFDNTLDVAFEGVQLTSWKLFTPLTFCHAFFGYWYAPKTDVMAVFKRPLALPA